MHVGQLQQENQVHTLKEMTPDQKDGCGPSLPRPVTAPTATCSSTVMAGLCLRTCVPNQVIVYGGVYHGVAYSRFVVSTVSNCGIDHPAACSI